MGRSRANTKISMSWMDSTSYLILSLLATSTRVVRQLSASSLISELPIRAKLEIDQKVLTSNISELTHYPMNL